MYLGDTYIIYRDTCRYGPRSKKGKKKLWTEKKVVHDNHNKKHTSCCHNFLNLIHVLLGEKLWIHVLHIYLHYTKVNHSCR